MRAAPGPRGYAAAGPARRGRDPEIGSLTRSAGSCQAGSCAGFTLVEVLVAFAVAALAMIAAFQVFGESAARLVRSEAAAGRMEEAAVLVAGLAAERLQPGLRSGRFADGTPYEIVVSDAGAVLGPGGAGGLLFGVSLYQGPRPGRLLLRTVVPGGGGGG